MEQQQQQQQQQQQPQSDLDQLPAPIKSKLKKFAKYEEKYPILLDAYKIEKKRMK